MGDAPTAGHDVTGVAFRTATPAERAELLALMRTEMAVRLAPTLASLGMTWPQFAALVAARGEVRAVEVAGTIAGYVWIEQRGRDLHLHAIIVLASRRGRGVGSAVLRALEAEFAGHVEAIELGVEDSNARARAWYLRQGYRVTGTLPELGFEIMRKAMVDRGGGGSSGAPRPPQRRGEAP